MTEILTYGPELQELALRIADSCAASDIESNCPWRTEDDEGVAGEVVRGAGQWYDTSLAIDGLGGVLDARDQEWLTDSLRYLELRGLLIRKEGAPHLVRIRDDEAETPHARGGSGNA